MAYATVHALSTGALTLPERFFITPADQEARRTVPSLSFLIQHHSSNSQTTRLVFDLGLRRDTNLYPSVLQKHIASRSPVSTQPDAVASLAKGGLNPTDIDFVLFSHVHYDHVGLPSDFHAPTKFIVGPGALDLLSGQTKLNIGSHSFFEPDLLPEDRTIELPTPATNPLLEATKPLPLKAEAGTDTPLVLSWSSRPLAPFEATIDLFRDGTVYILHAPGHLPGHVNLLVRTSASHEAPRYVILAGDACHDIRLFTGERDIATWTDDTGRQCCIHYDIPRAKETIARLAKVQKEGIEIDGQRAEVEVVFAHNWAWEEDAVKRNRFWPGRL